MIEKTFGYRKPDVIYKERVGAYGVGFDANGKIPVVMTHIKNGETAYFLLGGGIENNEKHTDCIIRECIEEAGLSVTPKDFICKGDFYHIIEQTKTDFHGIGYFYFMEINEIVAEPTGPDHSLVWLTIEQAREKLFLPHQIWAVEEIYKNYIKEE
jgi:8-oxo-dGTP diphosphatase